MNRIAQTTLLIVVSITITKGSFELGRLSVPQVKPESQAKHDLMTLLRLSDRLYEVGKQVRKTDNLTIITYDKERLRDIQDELDKEIRSMIEAL